MIHPYLEHVPKIDPTAYIAQGAHVIGRVTLAEHSSIWFNAILRGDINSISVGRYSNVQDLSICHVADEHAVVIGDYVVVGHHAQIHGCTLQDRCLIGIGAIVLNGAVVGEECIVGAGSLVPEGMVLESGYLYLGTPVKKIRLLKEEERASIMGFALKYARVAENHAAAVKGV